MEEFQVNRQRLQILAEQVIDMSLSVEKREEELWLEDCYHRF